MSALTKIIVIFGVGIGLAILSVTMLVVPLLKEVNAINANVKEKKTELAILEQQIRAFKTAQSDLAKATRKQDILNAIPTKEDLVLSVLDVENASKLSGSTHTLQIREQIETKDKKQQVPSVISKKSGVDEVPYDLNVVSDFAGIVNFMSYLEHLPHFTEIGKIDFTSERLAGSETDTTGRSGQVFADFGGAFFTRITK